MDITEFFRKLKCVCYWDDPFKDLKWSNVPRVKLSSFPESDDTLLSLQALSNLHYLFSGFMDYLWSRELNISNFGPANRFSASTLFLSLLHFGLRGFMMDGSESHNLNLRAILTNDVASCLVLSD
nr:hypothetical protein [Tanacetum cinerariifolium]